MASTSRPSCPPERERRSPGAHSAIPTAFVFGTVGRLQPVKNQALLARAFVRLLELAPELRERVRLIIVGDGPMRGEIADILAGAGVRRARLAPRRARRRRRRCCGAFDVFVLPSLAEGISNTILEAMASGLPVIATDVGGNAELVDHGATGMLVPSEDPEALAQAMLRYARDPALARAQGAAGRTRAERLFSLDAMVARYTALYDRLLQGRHGAVPAATRAPAAPATTQSH